MPQADRRWYRLDNAARLFPALISQRTSTVFRVACVLKKPVDEALLQQALDRVIKRFPSFRVRLRDGLFWAFLEQNKAKPKVQQEVFDPCRAPQGKGDRGFLFRVLVFDQRICVECSHALTDGMGSVVFLSALLAAYFELMGVPDAGRTSVLDLDAQVDPAEQEDGYAKHFDQAVPPAQRLEKAWRLRDPLGPASRYDVLHGLVPVAALKEKAQDVGASMTEYLAAHHLMALQAVQAEAAKMGYRKRPLRLMLPVNLRRHLPSISVHNFFLPVYPEIDPRLGVYTFKETLDAVHHDMGRMNVPKWMSRQIARNVKSAQHPFVRAIPNPIKRFVVPWVYAVFGSKQHSGVFSNLGPMKLPEAVADQVERFEFIPNPNPATIANLGVIAFGHSAVLSFASLSPGCRLPGVFFGSLRQAGIPVKLESNRGMTHNPEQKAT